MHERQERRTGRACRRIGKGPPLLLLHGIPGSSASWIEVADRLRGEFELIIPDLLGFGGSDRPRDLASLHAAAQAERLSQFLDELGIPSVAVAGHDFGGPVAILLHARRPERVSHRALFAANLFTDTPIPLPLSLTTWPAVGSLAAALLFSRPALRAMLRLGIGSPRVKLHPAAHIGDASQGRAIRTIFARSLANLRELYAPVEAHLARIAGPRLVGWGDRDPFFPTAQGERAARALGVPLRLYRQAGHFLPEERPDEIADDLRRLLRAPQHETPSLSAGPALDAVERPLAATGGAGRP